MTTRDGAVLIGQLVVRGVERHTTRSYLIQLEGDQRLELVREPENVHDRWAVRVEDEDGSKIGYIPREYAQLIGTLLRYRMGWARVHEVFPNKALVIIDIYVILT